MEVRIKMNAFLKHVLPHTLDDVSLGTSSFIPWKSFRHIIDLVHYHIVHLHVLWSIILCNQSGHHAQEDWVKLKHAFKNACCIKNITHKNLTKNCIFSCLTFFLHWVVFLIFMEVRIKMNASFKPHLTLHI